MNFKADTKLISKCRIQKTDVQNKYSRRHVKIMVPGLANEGGIFYLHKFKSFVTKR